MTTYRAPYRIVMDDALVELGLEDDEELKTILSLAMGRQMNMVGGRPSDCMRSEIYHLRRLGRDEYIEEDRRAREAFKKMGY